ncbi:aromatic ring-hydroxylating oxygenase subunit alpha [Polyangium aurulentum]|uniref:aromatic ring-hydroxylating dioxygenase subunit alpha n=1 Tax=Polyangium aurulentum TaxID=2567896 RepID=UPI0010AE1A9D|nr:aromatic ring-hydroxylating dioxygenase subunit alpha [Polyangium aurulentum]UQA55992.1 Rieske 2Fe-2S domain-containing protein [Polyangium aurulentum]
MLKNFWYVVEDCANVGTSPKKVTVLGQDLVLFRKGSDGRVVALSNLCVHRMGSLARGTVDGDCVRCPYHGWTFGADGACTSIPANPPGTPIPKKARVDSYPVEERYGWVWVFLGDLPESERPTIPALPEFGQPGWRAISGQFTWKAHYSRVVENGADIAHAPFVHSNSFGNRDNPVVPEHEVKADEHSLSTSLVLESPAPRGLWKFVRRERSKVSVSVTIHMPTVVRLDLGFGGKGWRNIVFDANTPIDESTTLTRYIQIRNFFTGSWADRDAHRRMMQIFHEDQPTVESQVPKVVPYELGAELSVKSDAMALAHRRLRKKYIDMGYCVDAKKARHAYEEENRAVVIPSPLRRAPDLKKAWVLDEVPVVEPHGIKGPAAIAAEE